MRYSAFILFLTLTILTSCGPVQNEGQTDWATVDFSVENAQKSSKLQAATSGDVSCAIIIAVPDSIDSVSITDYISSYYSRGLLDLASRSVELSLPLNVSLRVAEVTFTDDLSLSQIINNEPTAYTVGISDSFYISGSDSSITVSIPLSTPLSSDTAITAFKFSAASNSTLSEDVSGTIDETDQTIGLTVPYGTDVTALVATFTTTGQSVTVDSNTQISDTTANDFSSMVTYQVTAEDSSTQDYTVAVTVGGAGDSVSYTAGSVSITMIYMPGGLTFPTGNDDSGTATVTDAYFIGQTEVTYELWSAVHVWATSNGYTFSTLGIQGDSGGGTSQHPVTTINWRDAMVWMNALTEYYNAQNGTSLTCTYYSDLGYTTPLRNSSDGFYGTSLNATVGGFDDPYVKSGATGFRLLTSDEWELAARYIKDDGDNTLDQTGEYYPGLYASGADAQYSVITDGSDFDGDGDIEYTTDVAVYLSNSGSATAAVKSKSPDALGLYDMCGNVWEWVFDLNGTSRVRRGGSWKHSTGMIVGAVFLYSPYSEGNFLGFRFARTP